MYLANPKALNWGDRRVKNDVVDAHDLADMLRMGRLAQAWIAPPAIRQLRELVRYRAKLVQLRSGLKAQVHAVMAKQGVLPRTDDMFGPGGNRQLDQMDLDRNYAIRVQSLRDLIRGYDREIVMLERDIHAHLKADRGYQAVQAIKGVGPTIAAVLVAEIGDVSRFPTPAHLCSWAGLTPRHHESDTKTRRGRISKQGSRLLRWALIEAISCYHGGEILSSKYYKIAKRRGTNKARVAVAARSSRSPTTGCGTARSAVSHPKRRPRETRTRPCRELDERHEPSTLPRVVELIEPDMAVAIDPIMRTQREYMPRQPSLPTALVSPRRAH